MGVYAYGTSSEVLQPGWLPRWSSPSDFSAQTDKKTEEAHKKDAQALSKLADAALAAQGSANELNVTWVKEDFLKGPKDKQFVPFTITLDPTKVTAGRT